MSKVKWLNKSYTSLVIIQLIRSQIRTISKHAHKRPYYTFQRKRNSAHCRCGKQVTRYGLAWFRLIEMEVLQNHRRKCMLQCLPLISTANDCRCHLVGHQHRDDNVVMTTLSTPRPCVTEYRTLYKWTSRRVLNRVRSKPLLTEYYIHISWGSSRMWYSNHRSYSQIRYKNINYWKYL